MFENVLLPDDSVLNGGEPFPITHQATEFFIRRDGDQGMKVIRHQDENPDEPIVALVIKPHRIEEGVPHFGPTKVILATLLAATGDEEHLAGANPRRCEVVERFAAWNRRRNS